MRELDKPIGKVFRRLRFQRFLAALVWSLAASLFLATVAFGVEKFLQRPLPGPDWVPFAAAGGLSLLVALLIAVLTGPTRVDAAVAIDRAFHLNERISSVLTLPADLRASPAGRALLADTIRHVDKLDIGAKFGLRVPRRAWVPIVPAVLALGLVFLPVEWVQRRASANRPGTKEVDTKVVAEQTKALSKTIAQKREQMDKADFPEAEKLLAQIEKATEQLAKTPGNEKDKAMVELNKLTDAVKERQKQIGDSQQIQKQLQQLKELTSNGPADEFAKEMAKGDFQKAMNELQKLQDKLTSGKMTEQEKKELKQQLADMQKKLNEMANLDQRKKQLEEAQKNGTITKEQFEQQMAKLNEQAKDLQKMKEMANQLAQAQKAMDQGDMQKAADALGMSKQEIAQMAKDMQELEMLDSSLADLQDAKNAMNGEGANQLGARLDDNGLGRGDRGNQAGSGMGRGRGQGARPEAPDNTATYKTKVHLDPGKGTAIKIGQGPPRAQTKGESIADVQETAEAGVGLDAEALSNQKVPKAVQKHVTGYFDQFRRDNP